jgi:hypothetical protein
LARSLFSRGLSSAAETVDHAIGWHRLPRPLGLLTLVGIRERLRNENLHDTGRGPLDRPPEVEGPTQHHLVARTRDGTYNDLDDPLMGSIGSRFGRNIPPQFSNPEKPPRLLTPNPRTISRELLERDSFKPATTLNLLAAAWIQFEVHDWLSHGVNEPDDPWQLPLDSDDPWPEHPMRIPRTKRDPSAELEGPTTFVTADSHWWDGSQIYGSDAPFAQALRSGDLGKLRIGEDGLPPADVEAHVDLRGVAGNFWLGLALLHALFMLEHNAICDRLHAEYPSMSDQVLYDKARLVNAALMAKIHTIDWTPAIIAHPTTVLALNTNWWGLFGEQFVHRFGRITSNELIRGIPGSPTDHFGVPYSLTEEFVAVYRMHPLVPDEYAFWSRETDELIQENTFPELTVLEVRQRLQEISLADGLYSFGLMHPGAITLHNYPRSMQNLRRPDGELLDMAALDVLRVRERGVPRYNQFRRLFHLKPARTFEELTDNPQWAEEMRGVYSGDLESVDLLVGLYAEPKPRGFGFSDTTFRVFVLMASRRLNSDRFLSRDYRPEVYTPAGYRWVEENNLRSVLLRHFPELEPSLQGVGNPFAPWRRVSAG